MARREVLKESLEGSACWAGCGIVVGAKVVVDRLGFGICVEVALGVKCCWAEDRWGVLEPSSARAEANVKGRAALHW